MLDVIIAGLAGYRLAGLMVQDDGPGAILDHARARLGAPALGEIRGPLGGVLSCMRCATVWATAAAYLAYQVYPPVVEIIAAASIALLAWEAIGVRSDGN